jgi:hypothetical protein
VILQDPGVRRGDPLAGQVLDGVGDAGAAGEPEGGRAEAEAHDHVRVRVRVEHQVAAGDADVEGALADVHGDVARAQVVELDLVGRVGEGEVLGGPALFVAGLGEHLDGGFAQRALVGYCDAQHGTALSMVR